MNGLLRYDGPLYKIVTAALKCLLASLLWLGFSAPIITAGAASAALYHTVFKVIRKDEGNLWAEFWWAFKSNFKQATVVWLIVLPVLCFLLASGYNALVLYKLEIVSAMLPIAVSLVLVWVILWASYLFPCIARFQNTTGAILKNCSLFIMAHPLWSLLLLLVFLAEVAVVLAVPGLLPVVPVFGTLLSSYALEQVFRKYIPADGDIPQDQTA